MKVIKLLLILSFTGCGFGYEVKRNDITNCTSSKGEVQYSCKQTRPLFFFDNVLKICDSLEECNKFCEEKRK